MRHGERRRAALAAGAAAAAFGALIWFLCTRANAERALDAYQEAEGRSAYGFYRLAIWLTYWSRDKGLLDEQEGLGLGFGGQEALSGARIGLAVLLFGAGVLWTLCTLPPTARRWPLTLLVCWVMSLAGPMLALILLRLLALPGAASDQLRLDWFLGTGAPVLAAFGIPAACIAVAVAALVRRRAPAAPEPPAAPGPPTPVGGYRLGWATAGAVLPLLLMLGILGNQSILIRLLEEGDRGDGSPVVLAAVRWLLPGVWHWEQVNVLTALSGTRALVVALLHLALAAALFWAALPRLPRRTLPGLVLTGAWTGVLAGLLAGSVWQLLSEGRSSSSLLFYLDAATWYLPGALLAGLLGGLAAWLAIRAPLPPRLSAPYGAKAAGQGPEDELLITVSR